MNTTTVHRVGLLLAALVAFSCRPGESRSPAADRVVLPAGEVHEGWYFAGGSQVIIEGTINGDAYVAGALVDIEGTINGQLVVAGGQVSINGTVTDRVIAAGGIVQISGRTGKSITTAGGSIVIRKGATIGENLLAGGGTVQVFGTIGKEAKIGCGDLQLTGSINGNLDVTAEQCELFRGSSVGGNLTVVAEDTTKVRIEEGTVRGKIVLARGERAAGEYILGMKSGSFYFRLFFALSLFVTALLLVFVFPRDISSMGMIILRKPGESILWGVVTLVVIPIIVVLLCITLVGIPLGLFLLFLYCWLLYLSQLSLGVALSYRMLGFQGKHGWKLFGAIALGLLIVEILMFVPYVRPLLILLGMVFGFGALAIITQERIARLQAE